MKFHQIAKISSFEYQEEYLNLILKKWLQELPHFAPVHNDPNLKPNMSPSQIEARKYWKTALELSYSSNNLPFLLGSFFYRKTLLLAPLLPLGSGGISCLKKLRSFSALLSSHWPTGEWSPWGKPITDRSTNKIDTFPITPLLHFCSVFL